MGIRNISNIMGRVSGLITLTGLMIFGNSTNAQTVCDSTVLYFFQSKSNIDSRLNDNKIRLDSALEKFRHAESSTPLRRPSKVLVVGGASPEGTYRFNEILSQKRANQIFNYFKSYNIFPDSITAFQYIGRDWKGLKEYVMNDENAPARDEVIKLLERACNTTQDRETIGNETLAELKVIDNGKAYQYLYNKFFPSLRKSTIFVEFSPEYALIPNLKTTEHLVVNPYVDSPRIITHFDLPHQSKNFYMSLKTNMLYDILAVPNLGAEFYLGKNWSITGNGMYGWWSKDSHHRYWRIYGGEVGIRKWFGKASKEKPLTGHHLGAYTGVFTYDFEFGGRGVMGGIPGGTLLDRCQYIAAIEYGYSLPVSRRINIDFTFGLGYIGGKYLKYKPYGNSYLWQSTHHLNWVGPTKLEVSLVWLLGNGNFNTKKGGAR